MYIHVSIIVIMQEIPSLHLYSVPVVVSIKESVNNHNNNSNPSVVIQQSSKGMAERELKANRPPIKTRLSLQSHWGRADRLNRHLHAVTGSLSLTCFRISTTLPLGITKSAKSLPCFSSLLYMRLLDHIIPFYNFDSTFTLFFFSLISSSNLCNPQALFTHCFTLHA